MEYGPLIASVLLRIRLELCVLESFLYEAVIPFIREKGLTWVLPFHETVETFLAGTIFAIASNFILLGSTKILTVLFIYADTLTGMPTRAIGGGIKKISKDKSATNVVGNVLKAYGEIIGKQCVATSPTYIFFSSMIHKCLIITYVTKHQTIGTLRNFIENTDSFVGKYLVIITTIYIAFKFAHFKLFNDIF